MENENRHQRLKDPQFYYFNTIKFYDIKTQYLAQIIFVVILAISFLVNYWTSRYIGENLDITNTKTIFYISMVDLGTKILISFISSIYLIAYLSDLKNKKVTFGNCMSLFVRNSIIVLIASVFYVVAYYYKLQVKVTVKF